MTDKEKEQTAFTVNDRRGETKEESSPKPQPERQPPPKKEAPRPAAGPVDFSSFVISMSTSAVIHMGLIEDPHTGKANKNLPAAKQEVDILEMLTEKTRGNLTPEETEMMEQVLYELRLRFVQASK